MKIGVLITLLAIVCSCSPPASQGSLLSVATSVSPITDLVHRIGQDLVELSGLVPEGVNAHTFEPSPRDVASLATADLIFLNGLGLEEGLGKLAHERSNARVVLLGEMAIPEEEWIYDDSFPKESGHPNPHSWTNPPYAKRFTALIEAELSKADPDNKDVYKQNRSELDKIIDSLDGAVRTATSTVPPEDRKLLTYHDSFPYFAREYGWSVISAIQPSDFSEPSAADMAALIEQIKSERVKAVFGSEVFPSPVLEQIARLSGARYVDDLRDDDLPGEPGDADHSYIGLMRFDYTTIVEALGGDASAIEAVPSPGPTKGSVDYRG
ncbi:MAG TPA: metal ABC transporter substrate-binding protein [Actinomycetota bacterium]|nr:metal ABC transporter substrate-binding protein [Actinomycetota bacterium]